MDENETRFCVSHCKHEPLSAFSKRDHEYFCDALLDAELEMALGWAEALTGKRELRIEGEHGND